MKFLSFAVQRSPQPIALSPNIESPSPLNTPATSPDYCWIVAFLGDFNFAAVRCQTGIARNRRRRRVPKKIELNHLGAEITCLLNRPNKAEAIALGAELLERNRLLNELDGKKAPAVVDGAVWRGVIENCWKKESDPDVVRLRVTVVTASCRIRRRDQAARRTKNPPMMRH